MSDKKQKKCFVLIPFADDFEEIFQHAIKAAAEEKGYICERMKEITGPINIVNEIVGNIFDADLIVADLSGQNANVYYELGVAHSVPPPNKSIMIAAKDDEIPFDIAIYQVLKYERGYEGILRLRKGIAEQIEFIENQPQNTTNPVHDFYFKKSFFSAQPFYKLRAGAKAEDDIFAEMSLAKLRLDVLYFLDKSTAKAGMTITEIYRELGIQKRKDLVAVLNTFFEFEMVEKVKGERVIKWRLSRKGIEMRKKLAGRHS
jgi:hypothetical protein